MSNKTTAWKAALGLILTGMLIIGGVLVYRAGYLRGASSSWTYQEGVEYQELPHQRLFPGLEIDDGNLYIYRFFPGLFVGLLCLGVLLIVLAILGIGAARRQLIWRKNGLFDPLNLWEPPPGPEEIETGEIASSQAE